MTKIMWVWEGRMRAKKGELGPMMEADQEKIMEKYWGPVSEHRDDRAGQQ